MCRLNTLIVLSLLILYFHGTAELVPEVSQEGLLKPYISYSDVSLFHYHVPAEVKQVTWEFAAFMDDPGCPVRDVHVLIQHGSYPVFSTENNAFPSYMYNMRSSLKEIVTKTAYQPHDATLLSVFNPLPGSWFAAAYIPHWNEQMQQQGLVHKCRYSLGSVAMWTQHDRIKTLNIGLPQKIITTEDLSYYRFYVPSHTWLLHINVSACRIYEDTTYGSNSTSGRRWCIRSAALNARALPDHQPDFIGISNITDGGSHLFIEMHPFSDSYYYLLFHTEGQTEVTVTINSKECGIQDRKETWNSNNFNSVFYNTKSSKNLSVSSTSYVISVNETRENSTSSSAAPFINTSGSSAAPLTNTAGSSDAPFMNTTLSPDATLMSTTNNLDTTMLEHSTASNKNFSSVRESRSSSNETDDGMVNAWSEITSKFIPKEHEEIISGNDAFAKHQCFPVLPLARIKHSRDFTDTFLVQGPEWFSSWVSVKSGTPIYTHMTLLPYTDIGGTLSITLHMDELLMNATHQIMSIVGCVKKGRPPLINKNDELECEKNLTLNISTLNPNKIEDFLLIPFPEPDIWYLALHLLCYSSGERTPCLINHVMVSIDVRTQPCVYAGDSPCGTHGVCQETHRGMFFFSTCVCKHGWRGWGCHDGKYAFGWPTFFSGICLLTASNVFFIPAIMLAIKWRFYPQALLFTATMIASVLYHACDSEIFSYCFARFEVLQFCDFFFSLMCFWVTVVSICASYTDKEMAFLHILGTAIVGPAVSYSRTALVSFAFPMAVAITVPLTKIFWVRFQDGHWPTISVRRFYVRCLGVIFAACGLCLFAFVQTKDNYKYVHSSWHMFIALSLMFLLPTRRRPTKCSPLSRSRSDITCRTPLSNVSPTATGALFGRNSSLIWRRNSSRSRYLVNEDDDDSLIDALDAPTALIDSLEPPAAPTGGVLTRELRDEFESRASPVFQCSFSDGQVSSSGDVDLIVFGAERGSTSDIFIAHNI